MGTSFQEDPIGIKTSIKSWHGWTFLMNCTLNSRVLKRRGSTQLRFAKCPIGFP